MGDLIRRSDTLESLGDRPENWTDSAEEIQACADWDAFHGIVTRLPAVDAVEVCRCGDCRYKDDGIDEDGIPFLKCLHGRSYGGTRINDYCSWGQRREDGDNGKHL